MIYAITLSLRSQERQIAIIINTEAPQEIIDLFIKEFALGNVIAQTKGRTKGTICYENGTIKYEVKP